MEKQENYSEAVENGGSLEANLEYSSQNQMFHHHARQSESYEQQQQSMFEPSNVLGSEIPSVDRTLSFADVMQFTDFGSKLALHHPQRDDYPQNQNQIVNTGNTISREGNRTGFDDPVNLLKFPVLNHYNTANNPNTDFASSLEQIRDREFSFNHQLEMEFNNLVQLEVLGNNVTENANDNTDENVIDMSGEKINGVENVQGVGKSSGSSKRKRPRTTKTTEEVESQRMTHIAVERNRRKQINEHLRVLRSLMPSSYVQRGDQASIIGGAIEFVRELEQLLQCLESQKRRRLYGDQPGATRPGEESGLIPQSQQQPLGFPPPLPRPMGHNQDDEIRVGDQMDPSLLLEEECAESKSCIADVEVKVLGFDALIKILSRRRHGQLLKAIAALEDLQLTILHTNITTIEQTVLYSFNVKVGHEARFTAEDIASSVQQIFTFIHANSHII